MRKRTWTIIVVAGLLLLVLLVWLPVRLLNPFVPHKTPIQVIPWTGPKGFGDWGRTADGFFGISTDRILDIWTWSGSSLKRDGNVRVMTTCGPVILSESLYAGCIPGPNDRHWPLVIAEMKTNRVIKKWDAPNGWEYEVFDRRISGNGKYVPVFMSILLEGRYRISVVDVVAQELRIGIEFKGGVGGNVRENVASDDGRFVALAGCRNGLAVGDVPGGRMLWMNIEPGHKEQLGTVTEANIPLKDRPDHVVINAGYAVFSPDGNTLYAADSGGAFVYAVRTQTGEIVRQWPLENMGAYRMSCLALSPDGAWLAAGSGPKGNVFLFKTGSDEKPAVLPHGLGTTLIVSFSPDSNYVASVAGGQVKIWQVKP